MKKEKKRKKKKKRKIYTYHTQNSPNPIVKTRLNEIPLTHIYMNGNSHGILRTL